MGRDIGILQYAVAAREETVAQGLSYGNDPYNHFTLDEIFAQFSQRILSDIAQLQEIRKNLTTKPQIIDDMQPFQGRGILAGKNSGYDFFLFLN